MSEPPTQELPPLPPPPGGPSEPNRPSAPWWRRHRTALVVAGGAVVAVGAGAGIAVAASDTGSSTPVAASSSPSPSSSAPSGGKASGTGRRATRATITAESSDRWTVRTKAGQTLTVVIGAHTIFGTKQAPQTRAQFSVGATVTIAGTRDGNTITAVRIARPATRPTATPSAAPTSG
jgi:hypothetical protein